MRILDFLIYWIVGIIYSFLFIGVLFCVVSFLLWDISAIKIFQSHISEMIRIATVVSFFICISDRDLPHLIGDDE